MLNGKRSSYIGGTAMNKAIALSILAGLSLLAGCAKKESRLSQSTLNVAIDPSSKRTIYVGEVLDFNAIGTNGNNQVEINPVWNVDASLGTFSPPNGPRTQFTATTPGTGKIYALVGDVRAAVDIEVSTLGGGDQYSIYTDIFNPELKDTVDVNSGYGSVTLSTDSSEYREGWQSFKAEYTITNAGRGYAGWSIALDSVKDMSAYANGHIRFSLKTTADVQVGICSQNIDPNTNSAKVFVCNDPAYGAAVDNTFHDVSIPVSVLVNNQPGTDLTQMRDMFIIYVIGSHSGTGSGTYLVDNVRWTTD